MELDVAFDPGDEGQPRVSLLDLPEEIQLKILHLLQPLDILALGRTCRSYSKYADNKQLWYVSKFLPCQTPEIVCRRCQWVLLSEEMPRFTFPPVSSLEQLGVLFKVRKRQRTLFLFCEFSNLKILFSEKDCCRRIWTILSAEGGLYPKCIHCRLLFKFYVK